MSCLFTLGPSAIEPDGSCPGNKRRCGPSGRNLQPDTTAQESSKCSSSRSSLQASDVTRLDLSLFGYSTTYALFLFVVADTDTQTRPESV